MEYYEDAKNLCGTFKNSNANEKRDNQAFPWAVAARVSSTNSHSPSQALSLLDFCSTHWL
jgi:hypothetical protein